MANDRKEILRVRASTKEVRDSYAIISRLYAILEQRFEAGMRKRGLELLSIREGERVLEIGFGTGCSLVEIAESVGDSGRAYGIDLTPEMIALTARRVEKAGLQDRVALIEGDAKYLPYRDNVFDAVYMASTLELFDTPDIPVVLSETRRVLKLKGRLGVASLSKEAHENSTFVRLYEWFHRRFPKHATCRPIYVEQSVKDAGYDITASEELMLGMVCPMKIVIALPV